MKPITAFLACFALALSAASAAAADVVVNGERLDDPLRRTLEGLYHVSIQPGRYWYDAATGLWGRDGGPAAGLVHPGLPIRAPLRLDASGGRTGVVVNGRELHAMDVAALHRCVRTQPGRYWVLASGIGGPEGGPPMFDLAALCGGRGPEPGGLQCDGNGSCGSARTRSGVSGIVLEPGGGAGFSVNGKYQMTP